MSGKFDVVVRRKLVTAVNALTRKSPHLLRIEDIREVTEPLAKIVSDMIGEECIVIVRPKNGVEL